MRGQEDRVIEKGGWRPRRIGPWRLLDIVQATMPFRAGMWGGATIVPEHGPADVTHIAEPGEELPGSNISEHERSQAVQRERARRFVRARRGRG